MRARRWPLLLLLLSQALSAAEPSVLRIGNGAEPESLDPQRASSVSALNILRDLDEGLTRIDAQGLPQPAAAQRWQIDEDGLRYRFELRSDARWSSGEPLTAQDFVVALRRAVDPQTGAPFAQLLAPIANAEAISAGRLSAEQLAVTALDARHLEIRLRQATPYFLSLLAHPVSFPVHRASLQRYGREFARAGRRISNGAYQLSSWVVHAQIELQRNPYYWDAGHVTIASVEYLATDDVDGELKRYLAGELDVTAQIPLVQARRLMAEQESALHLAPYLGTYYYGLNVLRPPLAGTARLRRALTLAIDRRVIVEKVMSGLATPAYSWVPPGITDYPQQRPDWADWPRAQQIAEARRLYREAGYSPQHPLQLELRYNSHDDHRRIAIVTAAMWKQWLGVQTTLIAEENKVFLVNRHLKQVTQAFRASWIGDYNDASSFLDVLGAHNGRNDTGWQDTAYDQLLEQASATQDLEQRRALLARAEQRLLDQQPLIPIYFYQSKHLVAARVRNWQDNLLDIHYSKDLRLTAPR